MSKDLNKPSKRAVIGLLHLRGKDTGRKLVILQVVSDTLAALTLSGAGLIGAVALGFIDLNLAFHWNPLLHITFSYF